MWKASRGLGCQSKRSKTEPLFPMSWIGNRSGVSRKWPERTPLTRKKFPYLGLPNPKDALPPQVPKEPQSEVSEPVGLVAPRPERVVAFTIKLDLSPYCASGEPVMSSMDCSAEAGIWVEKSLLC